MAVKGETSSTWGNQVLLDRVQNAGPGQVNVPTDKVYELGNYQAVGTILDIPDLSFPIESFDASAEFEAMLLNRDFATDAAGWVYDISKALPIDVASLFKNGKTAASPYAVAMGVAVPYLTLEQLSYRFGLAQNAQQSATFRGDSIFYTPGSVYIQETAGTNAANQSVALTHNAYPYKGDVVNGTRYALSVSLSTGERLLYGTDFTEAATGAGTTKTVTLTIKAAVPTTTKIRVSYSSDTVATYPQASHAAASATRPAAIRGRNIKVYINGVDVSNAWDGVQAVNVDWRVTLDRDLEFGNSQIVSQDFDVPDVSGSIEFKPRNPAELYSRIVAIAGGATQTEVYGALQQAVLPLDIVLYSPTDGSALKTLHIDDARFTVPGYSGAVQQKLTITMPFTSDAGQLQVSKGLWD